MGTDIIGWRQALYQQNLKAPVKQDGSGHALGAGTNASVSVSLAADTSSNRPYQLSEITYSFSGTPTGATLAIFDGSTVIFGPQFVTSAGPGQVRFDPAIRGSGGTFLQVVLGAAGAGITGALDVNAWRLL